MDRILVCKLCKFGVYICYISTDIAIFLGGYFFGAPCILVETTLHEEHFRQQKSLIVTVFGTFISKTKLKVLVETIRTEGTCVVRHSLQALMKLTAKLCYQL